MDYYSVNFVYVERNFTFTRNASHCLLLQNASCGNFQVSVVAINALGISKLKELSIIHGNIILMYVPGDLRLEFDLWTID